MNGLFFLLLLVAVACGYGLARWQDRNWRVQKSQTGSLFEERYHQGLQQLLNEQSDAAIETLISVLDINQQTAETHFALGSLWRKRGEVDRAIRIHQNLLSRANLSSAQLEQARLELALDYTRSGLLDRAETLLQALTQSASEPIRHQALEELVYVFQAEQEWAKAQTAAESLVRKTAKSQAQIWRHLQAHFACEQVEPLLAQALYDAAYTMIEQALRWAPQHPRVAMLKARVHLARGEGDQALKVIRVIEPAEAYLKLLVELAEDAYRQSGQMPLYGDYLIDVYHRVPSAALIPAIAEQVCRQNGDAAAIAFVRQELQSVEAHAHWASLLAQCRDNSFRYAALRPMLDQTLKFRFVCSACGFEGQQLHWCCPTCKTWL